MNSSSFHDNASGSSNSYDGYSNISFVTQSLSRSKSGITRARMTKVRRQTSSLDLRSTAVPETLRPFTGNSFPAAFSGQDSIFGKSESGVIGNQPFVFGENRSTTSEREVLDGMKKLNVDEAIESKLPDYLRKLSIEEGQGNSARIHKTRNEGVKSGLWDSKVGNSIVSELPNKMQHLNIEDIVELKTPVVKTKTFSAGISENFQFSAQSDPIREFRPKSRSERYNSTMFRLRVDQETQERHKASEFYSPMDVSPYHETLSRGRVSRENSLASNESLNLDNNSVVFDESIPGCSATEVKECEGSLYHSNINHGAEGPPEESVSGVDTESYKYLLPLLLLEVNYLHPNANTVRKVGEKLVKILIFPQQLLLKFHCHPLLGNLLHFLGILHQYHLK